MRLVCSTKKLSADAAHSDCLVLFAYTNEKKYACDLKDKEFSAVTQMVAKASEKGRFKGSAKETIFFRGCTNCAYENVLVVGLGEKKEINEETLRVAGAVAIKTLLKEKMNAPVFALESFRRLTRNADLAGRAVAEGILLGSYKYDELKSKKKDKEEKELAEVKFTLADANALKKFEGGLKVGKILAETTNFVRDLGNRPGNYITPTTLANAAKEASEGLGIKFQALGKAQIKALKMGAFLGVNRASTEEPRFIIMEYFGGKKSDQPVILVGKGLTFDTGGISIKPSAQMEEMKFDMCGGAAVIGAILALAKMKAKVNVVTLVPSTDNMPGGHAIKPGDVVTAMNGKTIEVNNTDAEGRLILSDALCYASEKYKPAAIIDAATLTGACVIALGNVFAGFFCKDENLLGKIKDAAETSGERIWQLPLVDDYVDDMKGTYADLSNIGSGKGGGSSQGAAFLSQFVKEGIPWAHFDIAGSAYHTGSRYAYNPDKGASGSAVRLFADLVQSLA